MTRQTSTELPFPTSETIDQVRAEAAAKPAPALELEPVVEEETIDHGVEESFPASDPVSVSVTKIVTPPKVMDAGTSGPSKP